MLNVKTLLVLCDQDNLYEDLIHLSMIPEITQKSSAHLCLEHFNELEQIEWVNEMIVFNKRVDIQICVYSPLMLLPLSISPPLLFLFPLKRGKKK